MTPVGGNSPGNPLGEWRWRTTFLLALASAAVGMGSVWRFSYLAGHYGGAPFVLTYIACLFLLAIPVLVAELAIGSHGRTGVVLSVRLAVERSRLSRVWLGLPWLAFVTGVLLVACYTVVAGWSLAYALDNARGAFTAASALDVGEYFGGLLGDGARLFRLQAGFLAVVVLVLLAGVRLGVGLLAWLLLPTFLAGLFLLVDFSLSNGDVQQAGDFLFSFQLLDFNREAMLVALGQAFYTLGIGVATGICYGAYAPQRVPVGRSVVAIALLDTVIAVAVGLAVFPLVFASNLVPSMGPGLLFVSLPYAFGNLAGGEAYGTLFFGLVALVALGSCVAILEPLVGALIQQFRLRRLTAVVVVGALVWWLAWQGMRSLDPGTPGGLGQGVVFRGMDWLAGAVLLPLSTLLLTLLVGWKLRLRLLRVQLAREPRWFFSLWYGLVRYIAPPASLLVLVAALLLY